jgi:hypothetical protein
MSESHYQSPSSAVERNALLLSDKSQRIVSAIVKISPTHRPFCCIIMMCPGIDPRREV